MALHIEHHPAAFSGNLFHCPVQLRAAVTAQGPEYISGQALGVHSHKNILAIGDITNHQCHVFRSIYLTAVADRNEISELSW